MPSEMSNLCCGGELTEQFFSELCFYENVDPEGVDNSYVEERIAYDYKHPDRNFSWNFYRLGTQDLRQKLSAT